MHHVYLKSCLHLFVQFCQLSLICCKVVLVQLVVKSDGTICLYGDYKVTVDPVLIPDNLPTPSGR